MRAVAPQLRGGASAPDLRSAAGRAISSTSAVSLRGSPTARSAEQPALPWQHVRERPILSERGCLLPSGQGCSMADLVSEQLRSLNAAAARGSRPSKHVARWTPAVGPPPPPPGPAPRPWQQPLPPRTPGDGSFVPTPTSQASRASGSIRPQAHDLEQIPELRHSPLGSVSGRSSVAPARVAEGSQEQHRCGQQPGEFEMLFLTDPQPVQVASPPEQIVTFRDRDAVEEGDAQVPGLLAERSQLLHEYMDLVQELAETELHLDSIFDTTTSSGTFSLAASER
eukprot:CAMPEP_0176180704 /NCGR_PEP_ID=MMETSP0120_2-20121206/92592_1 /TAXON_ID=160619 /ORGANISM="Kryptoperidinium foliaceum, Strain CCMP 1326" /LENGTH=281 /DNA_ID=CAMNT_0017518917 /DNA_START=1 /DNA_END=846 /DNA_ORIENTATION=-